MTAPKTGIPILDDTGKAIGDTVKGITSAAGSIVNQGATVVRDTVAGAAKNVERNVADTVNGLALATQGDFTGFDRTLINAALLGVPGGALVNPDEVNNLTGTTTAEQQLVKKATEQAERDAAAEVAKAQESAIADVASVISGQISARRRGPGRDMTLISGGGYTPGNYTLLTGV